MKLKTLLIPLLLIVSNLQALPKLSDHYVGELGEAWEFPSDHLPVGASIDDFHLITWNVLNTAYISWIEKNEQGLKRSLIMKEHIQENREEHVIQSILKMISHPTHPRSILSLQECGKKFLIGLQSRLPENMNILFSSETPKKDQNIIIYDSNRFTFVKNESKITLDAFPCYPGRPLMDIVLTHLDSNIKYRIINTHVPGDPKLPGRIELAKYVVEHQREDLVTLVMGDMNFNPYQMEDAFAIAKAKGYQNLANYYTIIGPDKCAKNLDHIFIHQGNYLIKATANKPEEVLEGLEELVMKLSTDQFSSQFSG